MTGVSGHLQRTITNFSYFRVSLTGVSTVVRSLKGVRARDLGLSENKASTTQHIKKVQRFSHTWVLVRALT